MFFHVLPVSIESVEGESSDDIEKSQNEEEPDRENGLVVIFGGSEILEKIEKDGKQNYSLFESDCEVVD